MSKSTTEAQRTLLRKLENGSTLYYREEKGVYEIPPHVGRKKPKPVHIGGVSLRTIRKLQSKGLIRIDRDGKWRLA